MHFLSTAVEVNNEKAKRKPRREKPTYKEEEKQKNGIF